VSGSPDTTGKLEERRKLIALVHMDMVAFSRLMGLDDVGTLGRLRALRRDLIDPAIEEHRGRLINTGGDSLLVVFDSVEGAVLMDADQPPERTIRFRVGINIGDTIVEGTDLYGNAVNVAARLQAECPSGCVCVSRSVWDHVHERFGLEFEELGPLNLKNIARPVEAFVLKLDASGASLASSTTRSLTAPVLETRVIPRLSIVVLPFTNFGNDPEQEYFADGITEEVTTDLSRIAHMTVISRNTAFTYRGKAVTTRQVGRDLGVRFVLEGSVRRLGNQLRVNAQLIDAETDTHLWAERFNGDTSDLFALQDEITSRIAVALNLELVCAEAARFTNHPDAMDYILRGRAVYLKGPTRDNYEQAITYFEHALTFDPRSMEARSWLATELAGRVLDGLTDNPEADLARANALIVEALSEAPRSAPAHFAKGQLFRAQRKAAEALAEYEAVVSLDRNHVNALAAISWCRVYLGSLGAAMSALEQVIRLSPRDPQTGVWFARIGLVHLLQSRIDEAILWLERACSNNARLTEACALFDPSWNRIVPCGSLAPFKATPVAQRHSDIASLQVKRWIGLIKAKVFSAKDQRTLPCFPPKDIDNRQHHKDQIPLPELHRPKIGRKYGAVAKPIE
jgi:TolB-like protein/class 3 adenylate cyclase